MSEKITIAEKFAATIAILEGTEPAIDFDTADAIAFLEDRAEKAKSKLRAHKVKAETEEFRSAVATFMSETSEGMTAKQVAEALSDETVKVSTQKASAALRFLAGEGILTVTEGAKAKDAKTYAMA